MQFATRAPKRFRLILCLVGFCTGIAFGSWIGASTAILAGWASVLFLGLFLLFRGYGVGIVLLAISLFCAGFGWAGWQLGKVTLHQPVYYDGRVQLQSLRFSNVPQQRAVVTLRDGPNKGTNIRIYAYDWVYQPGTTLKIKAHIQPSQFTSDRGSAVIGTSLNVSAQKVSDPPWLYRFRARLLARLNACLPEPYASLAIGLITGATDSFDTSFKTDLQRTGTTHLVAVSGYNVMIIALFLQRLGRRRGEGAGFALASIGLLGYMFLVGTGASILRGVIMAFLSLFAQLTGRITHRLTLLLLCATIVSVLMPLGMLYSLSWQLSFLAFAGIVFVSPLLSTIFARWLGEWGKSLGETVGAELLVLPLITYEFGIVSIVSPFVNLVVLSFVPLAMAVSAVQAVTAMVWLPAGRLLSWLNYPLLYLIVKPIQWASNVPFAVFAWPSFPIVLCLVSYGLVGLLFWVLLRRALVIKASA